MWWHGLWTSQNLPTTWEEFVEVFKKQFLQTVQQLLSLSRKSFPSLEDYVHHALTQLQKSDLEGENWFITCVVNDITNTNYHWIVHDKDPETFEEAVNIILQYHQSLIRITKNLS